MNEHAPLILDIAGTTLTATDRSNAINDAGVANKICFSAAHTIRS